MSYFKQAGIPATISEIIAVQNRLSIMSTEQLYDLADELEIGAYSPERDDVSCAIVDELMRAEQQISVPFCDYCHTHHYGYQDHYLA